MARISLIELPALKLLDEEGHNWTALRKHEPLGSKQILAAHLAEGGFDVEIANLKLQDRETEMGEVRWRDKRFTKVAVGQPWTELDPQDAEVWGLTVNYLQEREVACQIIRHLAAGGGRVVVGGSDVFAEPEPYLAAGATAVVRDKSGGANLSLLDHLLGREPREPLAGVAFPDGRDLPPRRPTMHPQDWPLPAPWMVEQTLGVEYWEAPLPESVLPIGAVMLDVGCDRTCDFCETPTYKLGYRAMTPDRALQWLAAQKRAGANSVIILSDQFLGRTLRKEGREEILQILAGARELGLALLWGNGLELSKATLGRGLRDSDGSPDPEVVSALWGWDGKRGCYNAYIPAERPVHSTDSYNKLLPWRQHCAMLEAIVRAGVPDISYGVIVGFPDDSPEKLANLSREIQELRGRLKAINPALKFRVTPFAIRPLPGTPQAQSLYNLGLIKFDDPAILGGFWTACADTFSMSYAEVSDWQLRLLHELSDLEPDWQGITAA